MTKLIKYDFIYLKKTSKFIIFPVVAIIFAFLSPLAAKYINELLGFLADSAGEPLIVLPDPVVSDSYAQYASNLFEIFLIVGIFVSVSVFMRDKNKGLLPLVLSKPINRTYYLLSKLLTLSSVILVSLILGGVIFTYSTWVLFGEVDIMIVIWLSLFYFIYMVFMFSVALFFSIYTKNYATASILTFVTYIVMSIVGAVEYGIMDYLPGRMMTRITEVILGSPLDITTLWTTLVTVICSGVLFFLAINKFSKFDL